jgi:hypothetical protein
MLAGTPLLAISSGGSYAQAKRRWTVTGERIAQLDGLDQAMQSAMQAANIRAGALAVTCMGKTLFERGYTWAEPGYPVTQPNSLFRLASVEKAFVVALTFELVKAGAVALDTRVFPYLDLYHLAPKDRPIDPRLNDITVKHLIENRSGFPRWFHNPRDVARALRLRRPPTEKEALVYMMTEPLLFTPGTKEEYSTLGHDVLAAVCVKAAGTDHFSAYRKYVKGPRWELETFPYTKEYTRSFKGPAREVRYDDPGRGLTLLDPYGKAALPDAYGGAVIFLEDVPGVLATAAAVARLVGNYAAYGYGPRKVSGRSGFQPGTRSWTESRRDRLDLCYIFNTGHLTEGQDKVDALRGEIRRVLDQSHIGCEVRVYAEENFAGKPWRTNDDERRLPDGYNDRVSSIQILSGKWEFFEHYNFNGKALKLAPGEHPRLEGDWSRIISSLRCVEPTLAQQVTAPPLDLSGVWRADDGATYTIRQSGAQISWEGVSADGGKRWTHTFSGVLQDNEIVGKWSDHPPGALRGGGALSLRVAHRGLLEKVPGTGDAFGGRVWLRDLSGIWRADDGGTYTLEHSGLQLSWKGVSGDGGKSWIHSFEGVVKGDTIVGRWRDHRTSGAGDLSLLVIDDQRMEKVPGTGGGFGGEVWTRE